MKIKVEGVQVLSGSGLLLFKRDYHHQHHHHNSGHYNNTPNINTAPNINAAGNINSNVGGGTSSSNVINQPPSSASSSSSAASSLSPNFNSTAIPFQNQSSNLNPPNAALTPISASALTVQSSLLITLLSASQQAIQQPLTFLLFSSRAIAVISRNSLILAISLSLVSNASTSTANTPIPSSPLGSSPPTPTPTSTSPFSFENISPISSPVFEMPDSPDFTPAVFNEEAETELQLILPLVRQFAMSLATTMLNMFEAQYPGLQTKGVVASKDFDAFSLRIPEAIRATAKQVITHLMEDHPNGLISNSILLEQDNVIYAVHPIEPLALLANLKVLSNTATDLLNMRSSRNGPGGASNNPNNNNTNHHAPLNTNSLNIPSSSSSSSSASSPLTSTPPSAIKDAFRMACINGQKNRLFVFHVANFRLVLVLKNSVSFVALKPRIDSSLIFLLTLSDLLSQPHLKP